MAVYTVRTRDVFVIGTIWYPPIRAAYRYTLPKDVPATREAIQDWLDKNAGDFQKIIDFTASIEDVEIPWGREESEFIYNDCMCSE